MRFHGDKDAIKNWARSHIWLPRNVSEVEFKSSGLTGQEISRWHSVQPVAWLLLAAPSQNYSGRQQHRLERMHMQQGEESTLMSQSVSRLVHLGGVQKQHVFLMTF